MKKSIIYTILAVVVLTALTMALAFSVSDTEPSWNWAVEGNDCDISTSSCTLIISGNELVGEYFDSGIFIGDEVPWEMYASSIISVTIGGNEDLITPTSTAYWFKGMNKITNFNFNYLDTYRTRDMSHMFDGCTSITNLDLGTIDTVAVQNSDLMFNQDYNIDIIKIGDNWNIGFTFGKWKNLTTSEEVLYNQIPESLGATYKNITNEYYWGIKDDTLYISNSEQSGKTDSGYFLDGEILKDMEGPWASEVDQIKKVVIGEDNNKVKPFSTAFWFSGLSNVTDIDFSNLDTSEVVDMKGMFVGCTSLTELDLTSLDVSKVEDVSFMFAYCEKLMNLNISNIKVNDDVNHCDDYSTPDFGFGSFITNTSGGTCTSIFTGCSSLSSLTVGENWAASFLEGTWTSKSTGETYTYDAIPQGVADTYERSILHWAVNNKTFTMSNNFVEGEFVGVFDVTDTFQDDSGYSYFYEDIPWYSYISDVKKVVIGGENDEIIPSSIAYWFAGFKDVEEIDLTYLNTMNVVNMEGVFYECESLKELDLSKFNTSNVVGMAFMFSGCKNLEEALLGSFDTSKVVDMLAMFENCINLRKLDLSSFTITGDTYFEDLLMNVDNLVEVSVGETNVAYLKNIIPNPSIVPESNGKWYNINGIQYLSSEFPTITDTYYAGYPYKVIYYDDTNKVGEQIKVKTIDLKLLNDIKRESSLENITTSFDSVGGSEISDIISNKTIVYTLKDYTDALNEITYEKGGNYTNDSDVNLIVNYTASVGSYSKIDLPVPVKNGYIFKGWATSADSKSGLTGEYTPEENGTLYATWEKVEYTFIDETDNQSYKKGTSNVIKFKTNGDQEHFKDLYINDKQLEKYVEYTLDNNEITLTEKGMEYINTLPAGDYQVYASYDNMLDKVYGTLTLTKSQKEIDDENKAIEEEKKKQEEEQKKKEEEKENKKKQEEKETKENKENTPKTGDFIFKYFLLSIVSIVGVAYCCKKWLKI